jgi:YVTN family beta-propeller protein
MKKAVLALTLALGGGGLLLLVRVVPQTLAAPGDVRRSVYVGAQVCAECHDGQEAGHQSSRFLLTKHARAYAALASPEAKKIAELSGIAVEPQQSPMCLGCHSTGTFAEAAEKDDTFFPEEGVSCELCHGAGSDHVDAKKAPNRPMVGHVVLANPSKGDCLNCHREKDSHTAVLGRLPIDIEKGWKAIAHPSSKSIPKAERYKPHPFPPLLTHAPKDAPKYTGVMACAQCHREAHLGYQFSKWRLSKHADAYAVLATPAAQALARAANVTGDPQHSPQCLRCHTTPYTDAAGGLTETFTLSEGVGCEACHGAGSAYSPEAVMRDKQAAQRLGLKTVTKATCLNCHENAHGKPFAYEEAREKIVHPTKLPKTAEAVRYKTPRNLALRPGGQEIYVTCEAGNTICVVDTATRRKVGEIAVGLQPIDVTFSPDGSRAFVTNQHDDTVSVIDAATRRVISTIPVGGEPHGLLTDRAGRNLYVLDMTSDSISVIDTITLKPIKRLSASRSPWSMSLSPDGTRISVTNNLSRFVPFRTPSLSEITVIDTEKVRVQDRAVVPAANLLQGIKWHPGGDYALFTLNRTKNLVPMTRLLQGWTITNGLGLCWKDGDVDQVLLDTPGLAFPDPTDLAITPDGRLALVTSSSSDRIAVVDLDKLTALLKASSVEERAQVLPNHLGKSTEFVRTYIPTQRGPRGILVDQDGRYAYVANSLDDSVGVIDLRTLTVSARIDLGGPKEISKARSGERLFNSARITFHRQFSCHSCHPDGHIDGLTYNSEPSGIGFGPVDNRTLRGIVDTAPFKWEGTNPSLKRQCGARLAVFFTRIQPFTTEELSDLEYYICTIPRPPNRYRPLGAPLTEQQRRGKVIFERTRTNDGREIPKENRCITCHYPPLYTDRQRHNVGTKHPTLDHVAEYDTPHLSNIYDSAPYLHNGIAHTLEEIWTVYNPHDTHGITNDMTKDQLNDLIEFLKTL